MKSLLVATRNRGKMKEIRAVLDGLVDELLCADDIAGLPETVEDGDKIGRASCRERV